MDVTFGTNVSCQGNLDKRANVHVEGDGATDQKARAWWCGWPWTDPGTNYSRLPVEGSSVLPAAQVWQCSCWHPFHLKAFLTNGTPSNSLPQTPFCVHCSLYSLWFLCQEILYEIFNIHLSQTNPTFKALSITSLSHFFLVLRNYSPSPVPQPSIALPVNLFDPFKYGYLCTCMMFLARP